MGRQRRCGFIQLLPLLVYQEIAGRAAEHPSVQTILPLLHHERTSLVIDVQIPRIVTIGVEQGIIIGVDLHLDADLSEVQLNDLCHHHMGGERITNQANLQALVITGFLNKLFCLFRVILVVILSFPLLLVIGGLFTGERVRHSVAGWYFTWY